jgi:NADPH2:quinone reductase
LHAEGAAIPLAALTAAIGLYANDRLGLPQPTAPATKSIPLVIYVGSSAVGVYTIQLAQRSNIHPIIAVAGKAADYVRKLLDPSKGDTIVDYRQSDEGIVQDIKKALNNQKLEHAFDATADHNSYVNLSKVLDQKTGKITLVLPPKDDLTGKHKEIPEGIYQSNTNVGGAHGEEKDLAYMYTRYFSKGLEEG